MASTSLAPSWKRGRQRRGRLRGCATPKGSGGSASPRSAARWFTAALLDGLPLAHRAKREDGNDRHSDRPDERADEAADPFARAAVTRALEVGDRVADQAAAHTADD